MSQYSSLWAQLQAERAKLDSLSPAQVAMRNEIRSQTAALETMMSELAGLVGLRGLAYGASAHSAAVGLPEHARARSRAFSIWRDRAFWVASLHFQRAWEIGVLPDFDELVAKIEPFQE